MIQHSNTRNPSSYYCFKLIPCQFLRILAKKDFNFHKDFQENINWSIPFYMQKLDGEP